MLQIERYNNIIALVEKHGFISIESLMDALQVSRSTIRRDLLALEEMNKLARSRGGAISKQASGSYIPGFKHRKSIHLEEKQRIGEAALQFVHEHDTILLDEGTTTLELAKRLKQFHSLVVATYDLNLVEEMSAMSGINLVVSGGSYKARSNLVVGYFAEKFFSKIRADRFFMAADAVDLKMGCMCYGMDEIHLKINMINSSRETILLADHSKFETVEFIKVCGLDKIHTVVTGKEVKPEAVEELRAQGIKVVLA